MLGGEHCMGPPTVREGSPVEVGEEVFLRLADIAIAVRFEHGGSFAVRWPTSCPLDARIPPVPVHAFRFEPRI